MQTQNEVSNEAVSGMDEFQCNDLLEKCQEYSRKLKSRINLIRNNPEYENCSHYEREARERKRVLIMRSNKTCLCVDEAMTPTNFDWMYEDILKVIAVLGWEYQAIWWILPVELPIETFEWGGKFRKALLDKLRKEEAESPEIYERLPLCCCGFSSSSKDELQLHLLKIYLDGAELPSSERRQLEQTLTDLKKRTQKQTIEENGNLLGQAMAEEVAKLSDLNKLKIIKLADKLQQEQRFTRIG